MDSGTLNGTNGDTLRSARTPERDELTQQLTGGRGFLLPHFRTFSSMYNMASRIYSYRWDEAYRAGRENANAMLRDAYFRSLLQERLKPLRRWKVDIEAISHDPNAGPNPEAEQIRQLLLGAYNQTAKSGRQRYYLGMAIWYGRYGSQVRWERKNINGHSLWCTPEHAPVNGDKIQYDWAGHYGIMIQPQVKNDYPDVRIADAGAPVLMLSRQDIRDRFIIHTYDLEDADYWEADKAGRVAGIGLRDYCYWGWWLRDELIGWLMDFMEKVGSLGVMLFFYQEGSSEGKRRAEESARAVGNGNALAVPVPKNDPRAGGVELIPANTSGSQFLTEMISDWFERHIERLIIGQSMSGGKDSGDGLGGTGRAEFAKDTKFQLLASDAEDLAETLTTDWLNPCQRLNNLGYGKHEFKFVLRVPDPEAKEKLAAVHTATSFGVEFEEDEVRELTGLQKPRPGVKTIGGQQGMGGMPGMGGDPNSPFPAGGPDITGGAPGAADQAPDTAGAGGPQQMGQDSAQGGNNSAESVNPEQQGAGGPQASGQGSAPPELVAAMLELAYKGDHDGVRELAEFGSDPEAVAGLMDDDPQPQQQQQYGRRGGRLVHYNVTDQLGHEHGGDGKFVTKGGVSESGSPKDHPERQSRIEAAHAERIKWRSDQGYHTPAEKSAAIKDALGKLHDAGGSLNSYLSHDADLVNQLHEMTDETMPSLTDWEAVFEHDPDLADEVTDLLNEHGEKFESLVDKQHSEEDKLDRIHGKKHEQLEKKQEKEAEAFINEREKARAKEDKELEKTVKAEWSAVEKRWKEEDKATSERWKSEDKLIADLVKRGNEIDQSDDYEWDSPEHHAAQAKLMEEAKDILERYGLDKDLWSSDLEIAVDNAREAAEETEKEQREQEEAEFNEKWEKFEEDRNEQREKEDAEYPLQEKHDREVDELGEQLGKEREAWEAKWEDIYAEHEANGKAKLRGIFEKLAAKAGYKPGEAPANEGGSDDGGLLELFSLVSYQWTAAQTKSGKVKAVWQGEGQRRPLYGKQAEAALQRKEKGEADPAPGTPSRTKQMLMDRKAQAEPARADARQRWAEAIANGVPHEQLGQLAEHLQALTRDEIREMARALEKRVGGLKRDLVQRLVDHVRREETQQPTPGKETVEPVGVDASAAPAPSPQPAAQQPAGGPQEEAKGMSVSDLIQTIRDSDESVTVQPDISSQMEQQTGKVMVKKTDSKHGVTALVIIDPQDPGDIDAKLDELHAQLNQKVSAVRSRMRGEAAVNDRAAKLPSNTVSRRQKPKHRQTKKEYEESAPRFLKATSRKVDPRRFGTSQLIEIRDTNGGSWEINPGRLVPGAKELTPDQIQSAGRAYIEKMNAKLHRSAVESALSSGKPVPPEVLADYPDLAEKHGKKSDEPGVPGPSQPPTPVAESASRPQEEAKPVSHVGKEFTTPGGAKIKTVEIEGGKLGFEANGRKIPIEAYKPLDPTTHAESIKRLQAAGKSVDDYVIMGGALLPKSIADELIQMQGGKPEAKEETPQSSKAKEPWEMGIDEYKRLLHMPFDGVRNSKQGGVPYVVTPETLMADDALDFLRNGGDESELMQAITTDIEADTNSSAAHKEAILGSVREAISHHRKTSGSGRRELENLDGKFKSELNKLFPVSSRGTLDKHKAAVYDAIQAGKSVPAEALAEYPDLQEIYNRLGK